MIWIFPIAGDGTRTKEYGKFKPFIEAAGKKIIEWCFLGIKEKVAKEDELIFITTRSFENEFSVNKNIGNILRKNIFNNAYHVVLADKTPQGPAASVYLSKDLLKEKEPCTVINADQFIQYKHKEDLKEDEAYLPIYFNTTGRSSYVEIADGKITKIYEKEMKTHYASAGVYVIGSSGLLIKALEYAFANDLKNNNEFYIGPALNYIIDNGGTIYPIETSAKYDLGNVQGIQTFTSLERLPGTSSCTC